MKLRVDLLQTIKQTRKVNEMENLMFIRKNDDTQQIKICPLVGKIQGNYPEDFKGENTNE